MNDLVKFGTGGVPTTTEDLVKGLQNVGQTLQGTSGGLAFMRLLKSGVFAYGPENIEPEPGAVWGINPYSLAHGFACWGDGELLDERMVPFNQQPPLRGELPDYGHEWTQQVAMQMACLDGEDEGINVLYKGTSTGLRNAVKKLIDEIIAQAQSDAAHIVPVIELECDSYQHKKYGEIFFPVLEVKRWISIDDGVAAPEAEDEPEEKAEGDAEAPGEPEQEAAQTDAPAPTRRRRRKAAEKPAAKAEAAPTGNRRRRRKAKQ
jgi:hypothetical protein